jgi:ParB family transcriptional regulator, chromosome partitioning protein
MSAVTTGRKKPAAKASSRRFDGPDLARFPALANAGPMHIPLGLIDEDPYQPRTADNPGFSPESLKELADTIRLRGVKTPISVRNNPKARGRYIINHGTRRFRASALAGKTTIPGFLDNDYDNADQVVENLHRNALTPREIADYIGRELARGKKKRDIARELGKSPAFVSQHVTLLDLPDPIAESFNSGRSRDVTLINDLVTIYTKKPYEVTAWLADDDQEITRGSVKLLREFLDYKQGPDDFVAHESSVQKEDKRGASSKSDSDKLKKPFIKVKHKGRTARLILDRRPPSEGSAWLKYDDGQVTHAKLANVQLVALVEGYTPPTAKEDS